MAVERLPRPSDPVVSRVKERYHRLLASGADEHEWAYAWRAELNRGGFRAVDFVMDEVVDAAGVDGLVYDAAVARTPSLELALRVIDRSPSFGIPPVVVPHYTSPELRARLVRVFTTMHQSASGREILSSLGIDRFDVPREEPYERLREYLDR